MSWIRLQVPRASCRRGTNLADRGDIGGFAERQPPRLGRSALSLSGLWQYRSGRRFWGISVASIGVPLGRGTAVIKDEARAFEGVVTDNHVGPPSKDADAVLCCPHVGGFACRRANLCIGNAHLGRFRHPYGPAGGYAMGRSIRTMRGFGDTIWPGVPAWQPAIDSGDFIAVGLAAGSVIPAWSETNEFWGSR